MSGTLSIPASEFVQVTPSVIGAGGTAAQLIGVLLTPSTRLPYGVVQSFSNAAAVSTYFGPASAEYAFAVDYFLGFTNSTAKPAALLIAQFNQAAIGGFLRGASVTSAGIAALQAITAGTLTISIDGTVKTATAVNLSTATSYTQAGILISTALGSTGPTVGAVTGSVATTTLTVTAVTSGTLAVGQILSGTGITAGTYITALGTGNGGVGTYTVSVSQTVASEAITLLLPTVGFDSVSGAFVVASGTTGTASAVAYPTAGTLVTPLGLSQTQGAIISPGAALSTPSTIMQLVTAATTNWASFTTLVNPDALGSTGNTQKQTFAAWTNGQDDQFVYVAWDQDATPAASGSATASLGAILKSSSSSGTVCVYAPVNGALMGAFVMGAIASIDFTATQGETTLAYKGQTGLAADVTSQTVLNNLIANGYNAYCNVASASNDFVYFYPGSISGPFSWIDGYVDQIWLNGAFELALMELLTSVKSIPYNALGYGLITAALQAPIQAAVNFGAIQPGVALSAVQIAEVNAAAGLSIGTTLQNLGYYLQILPATAQARGARQSPPMTFWYVSGGSVQSLSLSSVEVE